MASLKKIKNNYEDIYSFHTGILHNSSSKIVLKTIAIIIIQLLRRARGKSGL